MVLARASRPSAVDAHRASGTALGGLHGRQDCRSGTKGRWPLVFPRPVSRGCAGTPAGKGYRAARGRQHPSADQIHRTTLKRERSSPATMMMPIIEASMWKGDHRHFRGPSSSPALRRRRARSRTPCGAGCARPAGLPLGSHWPSSHGRPSWPSLLSPIAPGASSQRARSARMECGPPGRLGRARGSAFPVIFCFRSARR